MSPFLYSFLVSLSLLVVALLAEGLEVCPVVESVGAYRPRLYVVNARRRPDHSLAVALRAKRMLRTERPREVGPPVRVVRSGGPFPLALPFRRRLRPWRVPW